MNTVVIAPLFARIVDDLATHGWSQQSIFIPTDLTAELAKECHKRAQQGQLEPAAIGRGVAKVVHEAIRGDHIQWLDAGHHAAVDRYLALIEQLRVAINQTLFLGLEDFESHFALYPPGAFYAKHLDRFRDDDRRVVSCVAYLNEQWLPEQGGALRMYLEDERVYDVAPQAGTLMVFMSAQWPHEVLPATRDRLSITGWFRRRA
ncbi:MAG: 2OG-Fe(II) oxygenase [Pseudomonas sp.]|jgi:SM-20-related protein|nr:2OG-Fe(II) oxygenase [Pseudomonas sp.]MDD2222117.1 2OG-Fe(II) oxygenase [Pseudomonas sp.]MDY0414645.1 2OG-Fe(II) oxygenase [Pseudomonas sp.]NLO53979.1 2OG-Fe(II) oxygenase [Gammaproteobacteria bacterium]